MLSLIIKTSHIPLNNKRTQERLDMKLTPEIFQFLQRLLRNKVGNNRHTLVSSRLEHVKVKKIFIYMNMSTSENF